MTRSNFFSKNSHFRFARTTSSFSSRNQALLERSRRCFVRFSRARSTPDVFRVTVQREGAARRSEQRPPRVVHADAIAGVITPAKGVARAVVIA